MTDVMTQAEYNDQVRRTMTEAVWQAHVLQILRTHDWLAFTIGQSTRGNTGQLRGDADSAGWPDVFAYRNDHQHSRAAQAYLELKRCGTPGVEAKQLSQRQREVLQMLGDHQLLVQGAENLVIHVGVLRPTDSDLLCDLAEDPWSIDPDTVPNA